MFDGPCLVSSSKKRTLAKVDRTQQIRYVTKFIFVRIKRVPSAPMSKQKVIQETSTNGFSTKRKVKKPLIYTYIVVVSRYLP